MATIAVPGRGRTVSRFYVGMAWLFVAIAFGGFFETYWYQLARGTFVGGTALLHLHGLLFFAWTLFFVSQATMVANGKLRAHKSWGLLGISLATAMVFTGFGVAIEGLHSRLAMGQGDAARAFVLVPVTAILLFGGFVAAAIVNLRRPEWHKRFMLVATASLLGAAIARIVFVAVTGGGPGLRPGLGATPPAFMTVTASLVALLPIAAAMINDWRRSGRVHPAYNWGFGICLAVHLLRPLVGETPAWLRFTDVLLAF